MNFDINIPCPACKKKFKQNTSILRKVKSIVCPHCMTTIKLEFDQLKKELDELDRLINNLPKKITIEIK